MSEELKPCPFCGNSDEVYGAGDRQGTYCDNCGADGPSYVRDGNPVAVWNDRRTPAEPAPASTGRDCRAVCQASKADGIACPPDSCDYEDGTRAPVAARELDVEAARLLLIEARAVLETWKDIVPAVSLCADIDKALAAGSARQGGNTNPEIDAGITASAAPVSTEQAGDAWISVEDRLPEPGERVLVSRFAGSVINPGHPGHPGVPWVEVSSIQPGFAIFSCDLCSTGNVTHWKRAQAAPSPNNSPVGADSGIEVK